MIPAGHVAATRPPAHHGSVSQAILELNRSGRVVDLDGNLTIAGEIVPLRIRQGGLVAVINNQEIPWAAFRQVLRPKPFTYRNTGR